MKARPSTKKMTHLIKELFVEARMHFSKLQEMLEQEALEQDPKEIFKTKMKLSLIDKDFYELIRRRKLIGKLKENTSGCKPYKYYFFLFEELIRQNHLTQQGAVKPQVFLDIANDTSDPMLTRRLKKRFEEETRKS